MVGVMSGHGVSDSSRVWHELGDLSHRKDQQHVFTLLLMHLEHLPTTDLSERGCTPCCGRQCVFHMMGRQMTHWRYAVHAHFTQGGGNIVAVRFCKGHAHQHLWFASFCMHKPQSNKKALEPESKLPH